MTRIGAAEYVALTTFRRDGTPVPSPVWLAPDGDRLVVWTPARSGKVARLRHTGRVTLAPCDFGGTPSAEPVGATARILPRSELPAARRAMLAKYGWKFRRFALLFRVVPLSKADRLFSSGALRRAAGGPLAIEITIEGQ